MPMTIDEKLAITMKAHEFSDAGDHEGYIRVMKTLPLPPYLAKVYKEKIGLQELKDSGWNLSEVEAEFGPDWLSK